uniref:Uncharacterized protein n=1 Tax=Timema shepardi TaxID=629360 RepID=A0A7R9G2N1_TIMSH|nr:unnamed protein product [Timema shepardi]
MGRCIPGTMYRHHVSTMSITIACLCQQDGVFLVISASCDHHVYNNSVFVPTGRCIPGYRHHVITMSITIVCLCQHDGVLLALYIGIMTVYSWHYLSASCEHHVYNNSVFVPKGRCIPGTIYRHHVSNMSIKIACLCQPDGVPLVLSIGIKTVYSLHYISASCEHHVYNNKRVCANRTVYSWYYLSASCEHHFYNKSVYVPTGRCIPCDIFRRIPARYVFLGVSVLGALTTNIMRASMSVAIVAMVRTTNTTTNSSLQTDTDTCPGQEVVTSSPGSKLDKKSLLVLCDVIKAWDVATLPPWDFLITHTWCQFGDSKRQVETGIDRDLETLS